MTLSTLAPARQSTKASWTSLSIVLNMALILSSCASDNSSQKPEPIKAAQATTSETDPELPGRRDPAADASSAQDPGLPKLICHREKVLGSNRSVKVCRTEAEIEDNRQGAKVIGGRIRNATSVRQRGVE